jgi:hypothetical protein
MGSPLSRLQTKSCIEIHLLWAGVSVFVLPDRACHFPPQLKPFPSSRQRPTDSPGLNRERPPLCEDIIQKHAEISGFPATTITEVCKMIDPTTERLD